MTKKLSTSKSTIASSNVQTKTVTNSAASVLPKKSAQKDLLADTIEAKKAEGAMYMKDGKMVVIKKGKIVAMKKNFTFPDGIKITTDGYAVVPITEGTIVDDTSLWMRNYAMNGLSAKSGQSNTVKARTVKKR